MQPALFRSVNNAGVMRSNNPSRVFLGMTGFASGQDKINIFLVTRRLTS